MPARSYRLQNAYPRRPDYTFRVYEGQKDGAPGMKKNGQHLRWLAEMLDSKFRLPGGIRVGWDGILGFIPGLGDVATSGISLYILFQAAMMGAPPAILGRMALNILIDNVLDFIPVIGNLFDFFWKSNLKNIALLDRYLADPARTARRSRWAIALTVAAVAIFAVALITAAVMASIAVIKFLFNGGGW
ncbi:MAG: DUF4112 domain-containing protein [Proteobacteria bacterium]|nr:MAG: DUF4112 domain-containing protein [Pseudomonadota bacterium]